MSGNDHGRIRRVSAPQRSPGRLISRRIPPVTGVPASQTRRGTPSRTPNAVPATALPRAEAALPDGHPDGLPATGPVLGAGPHPVELAGLLHELSARLLSADEVPQALERLAVFAAGALPGAVRCSVALITEGEPLAMAASGPQAAELDERQYAAGHGPGLESARTRALVTARDLASDARWPDLADCARRAGVGAVAAIPLDVARSSVGSLSVYVSDPRGIHPELLLTAMAIVNQAEILLGELDRRAALSEGATVDRAVGVIIAQRGCGVREAYDVLQETAQRLGMDRRSVAERLITAAARNADA